MVKDYLTQLKNELMIDDLLVPLYTTEWGKRASWAALGLFSLLLFFTTLQMFVNWYRDSTMLSHATPVAHLDQNEMKFIAQLPNQHIFGRTGGHGVLPITSMQIRLVGVMKASPIEMSRVIISEEGQPGKVYSVGDSLSSGIMINEVTEDGVVLENEGHFEKLPLERPRLHFQGLPKSILEAGN